MRARDLEQALSALGDLLESRGHSCDLVVIGGGAMLLRGYTTRVTRDIDAVAIQVDGVLTSAHPLPTPVETAVVDVARALGLSPKWLNGGALIDG